METAATFQGVGRRERRKLEVRQRMVEAAQALFEERGVQAATVVEICERADVAHKTFFNHFPAKQDIVRALADASLELLLEEIEAARAAGRDTASRLTSFFDRVAVRAAEAGPMHRELLTELIHAAQQGAEEGASARRLHAAFGSIVRDGIVAGEITRQHGAETLTETIVGTYYALMFNWANLEDYPIAARARAAASFLADALARRPGEGGPAKNSATAPGGPAGSKENEDGKA